MAEKLAFPDRSDGTLFTVDAQPEIPFQKLHHRLHHSLPAANDFTYMLQSSA